MGKTEGMFSVFLSIFLYKRHSTLGQKSSNMIFKSNSNQGDNRVDVKQANFLLVNIKLTVFFYFCHWSPIFDMTSKALLDDTF